MASLCSNSFVSYLNDWPHQELGSDFDLFQDLPLTLPSLDGSTTENNNTDFISVNLEPFLTEENIIKNHDCMWSGNSSPASTHSSSSQHSSNNNSVSSSSLLSSRIKIKEEPIDPAYAAIGLPPVQVVIPDPTKPNGFKQIKQERNNNTIAPGMSLLKRNQPTVIKKEPITSLSFSPPPSFSSSSYESISGRPDTPFSLDDEVKHAVDFYSCSIGSNNIPLEPFDKSSYIKDVRKQLEDSSTMNIRLLGHRNRTMSMIDEVIKDNITDESDTEDDIEDSMTMMPIRHTKMMVHSKNYISPASQTQSDHSYSRSKYGVEEINYETPIESDEEIDVVNLPTNPSEKDRRVLQSKVEYEIRKSNNSLRRRISYDPSYTPQSISPVKSSSANSRYPSPAQTPKYVNTLSGQRKRVNNNNAGHIIVNRNLRDDYLPPTAKRYRMNGTVGSCSNNSKINKKVSSMSSASSTTSSCSGPSSPVKQRHMSIDDDSNEKRNLHNDMERQRRIGLKNLFEALKKQIPSIKDKERAPKVNILREAAKLCDHVTSEEREILRHKQCLKEEIRQKQDRLRRLKSFIR